MSSGCCFSSLFPLHSFFFFRCSFLLFDILSVCQTPHPSPKRATAGTATTTATTTTTTTTTRTPPLVPVTHLPRSLFHLLRNFVSSLFIKTCLGCLATLSLFRRFLNFFVVVVFLFKHREHSHRQAPLSTTIFFWIVSFFFGSFSGLYLIAHFSLFVLSLFCALFCLVFPEFTAHESHESHTSRAVAATFFSSAHPAAPWGLTSFGKGLQITTWYARRDQSSCLPQGLA